MAIDLVACVRVALDFIGAEPGGAFEGTGGVGNRVRCARLPCLWLSSELDPANNESAGMEKAMPLDREVAKRPFERVRLHRAPPQECPMQALMWRAQSPRHQAAISFSASSWVVGRTNSIHRTGGKKKPAAAAVTEKTPAKPQ